MADYSSISVSAMHHNVYFCGSLKYLLLSQLDFVKVPVEKVFYDYIMIMVSEVR